MKWKAWRNLGTRLTLSILIPTILSISIIFVFLFNKSATLQKKESFEKAFQLASHYGMKIDADLEGAMDAARTLAQTFKYMKVSGTVSRDVLSKILEGLLIENPHFLGTYTCWEPNALDGKDSEFIKKPGHDATGRFIPYYNNGSGKIIVEPLMSYDKEGDGDYYQIPKKTKKEALIDPYVYPIAGKDTLLTSFVVPIIINDKFVGIAGIDIALSAIQTSVSKIKPYETGSTAVFSNSGIVTAHIDPSRVGKKMRETEANMLGENLDDFITAINKGVNYETTVYWEEMGTDVQIISVPFTVGKTETPWSFTVFLPIDKVMAPITTMKYYSVILALIATTLIGFITFFISKKIIIAPMSNMKRALKDLAEGDADLTQRLTKERNDEIGFCIDLFNKFIQRVQVIIEGVRSGTGEVFTAADEIANGNENLAQRTNELAASITETSTTMEQFTALVKQNTDNSEDADQTLTAFNNEIQVKTELIDNVTKTMREISDSSKKIDNIVSVINDISFQTNLLALNAAVEAARAGEAGRGFAVVASEVRILSGKTAESSKSIQDIVSANVEATNRGMELVDQTSELFAQIIDVINDVANRLSTITTGSREQHAGIEQINTTINQMDGVSGQNAAFVDEMATTGRNLKSSAATLQELVNQFKLS